MVLFFFFQHLLFYYNFIIKSLYVDVIIKYFSGLKLYQAEDRFLIHSGNDCNDNNKIIFIKKEIIIILIKTKVVRIK